VLRNLRTSPQNQR